MYDDEMTEDMLASTSEEYYRVTQQEKHDEAIACARAYIASLEAAVAMMKRRQSQDTLALMSALSRS
jgi:hypothetical protein